MDSSSFITSLTTSFIVFVILMILFVWLSTKRGNVLVYHPNRILKGSDPWEGSRRNPLAWIREALSSTEQDVLAMSGVDSAVYFVFLSTVFGILLLSGIVLLPVLLPVAMTEDNPNVVNSTGKNVFNYLDKLSMAHIKERSLRLWAFVIACYWVSLVSYVLLWKACKHVSDLRAAVLESREVKPEQFAVLVGDIPPPPEGCSRQEQVDMFFKEIYPEEFYKSMVSTEIREVNRIYEELEDCKKKLMLTECKYEKSKKVNPEGVRQTHRTGFLGLIGKKVDSIDYYNDKIRELTPKLEAVQKSTLTEKQQGSAVVFFKSRVTAAAAAQSAHARMIDTWTVTDAPEPRQLLWSNLPKTYYERVVRQIVVYIIVFLTIWFYMIPIGFISALTTLSNLRKLLPSLKPILDQTAIRTVLGAYLPQTALIVFLYLLPRFLMFLSKAEGITSQSHVERATSGKSFYFSALNVFLAVTLGGTLLDSLKDIERDHNALVHIATRLPRNATFFMSFVAVKFFVGHGLELSRIVPFIIFHLKKKYLCTSEVDLKEAWLPGGLGYATKIPDDMLILIITLCYSVIAPLIILFGAIYFGLGWLVYRNQVLNVIVPKYESYGKMWPHIHLRVLASLLLFQVTMVGYFEVKKFIYTSVIFPLPIATLIFAFVCSKKFYHFFQSTALEVACKELKDTPNMKTIYKSFRPASLHDEYDTDDENAEKVPDDEHIVECV